MANLLTSIRLLLILPVAGAMAQRDFLADWLLACFLILAIITDYYDGIVARAQGTASARGQVFDHSTDFLFVTSGLAGAAYAGLVPWGLPILIVLAFSQYVLDSHFLYHQKSLRMSFLGRWNGVFYFGPLLLIATARISPENFGLYPLIMTLASLLAYGLIASTLLSIADRAIAPLRQPSSD
jgi:CDP-diacylglycerol--glycerol-3-phosphate 3-phosphatidyltransferase